MARRLVQSCCLGAVLLAPSAWCQLRVVTWNISDYGGGRLEEIRTAVYSSFEGRKLAPDIILGQEFLSAAALSDFVFALNTASGSPGDWAAAPFINGESDDGVFVYRTSKVVYLGTTVVAVGSSQSNNQPRNTYRYDMRPVGYAGAKSTLALYNSHMKAGSAQLDRDRRLVEAIRIRDNAETLPAGWNFIIGADFNIQSSTEEAYVELVGSQSNNAGRFTDPINTPGTWNNDPAFRFVHTQDPATQMDDRFDQLLMSNTLLDGEGFSYIGNPGTAYSSSTWNDTNHSYRSYGNDGSSYNSTLRIKGNTMVGATIAQAILDLAAGLGHIPVFAELRVPPEVSSPTVIDFGTVPLGASATRNLTITNSGDVALWTATGIAPLNYTLTASAGFSTAGGGFVAHAGAGANSHAVQMSTSTPGTKQGTVVIQSNSPDEPERTVIVRGRVIGPPGAPIRIG